MQLPEFTFKTPLIQSVNQFLIETCPTQEPLLLALSGGPDSLCLFYCLLAFRQHTKTPFHVAHVDHGWRQESAEESQTLKALADYYAVPFHLKQLNPENMKGNLEALCREARHQFFLVLNQQFSFQAILTGHQQNDVNETVFKRICEGAHWSKWNSLKKEKMLYKQRFLRPLLDFPKKKILQTLKQLQVTSFDDETNRDCRYLRARLRQKIFPWLEHEFGKTIQPGLHAIASDAEELQSYFIQKLLPLVSLAKKGPLTTYLNLQVHLPEYLLEIKELLRLFCEKKHVFLSREILQGAAQALKSGEANKSYFINNYQLVIDRKRLFWTLPLLSTKPERISISEGNFCLGNWQIIIDEQYESLEDKKGWEEGLEGELVTYLAYNEKELSLSINEWNLLGNTKKVKKLWNQEKVPAFFYSYFPLVIKDNEIYEEFLTKKKMSFLDKSKSYWKIELKWVEI